ncbi:MAG: hypothetical protein ACKN9V_01745, partial [Pseudomonadota bacterium]
MTFHLVSIHEKKSERLPFVLIQMEALERFVGEKIKTQRFLLSELSENKIEQAPADEVFLFGVGTLDEEDSKTVSQYLSCLSARTNLIAVEFPQKGEFTGAEKALIRNSVNNGLEITAVSEKAAQAIYQIEPSAQVKVLGFLESLLEMRPISSSQSLVVVSGEIPDIKLPAPSIRVHFSEPKQALNTKIGLSDLYVSSFPWIGLKALATANCVVTDREEVARVAFSLGRTPILPRNIEAIESEEDFQRFVK